jgi:hypothetical protein
MLAQRGTPDKPSGAPFFPRIKNPPFRSRTPGRTSSRRFFALRFPPAQSELREKKNLKESSLLSLRRPTQHTWPGMDRRIEFSPPNPRQNLCTSANLPANGSADPALMASSRNDSLPHYLLLALALVEQFLDAVARRHQHLTPRNEVGLFGEGAVARRWPAQLTPILTTSSRTSCLIRCSRPRNAALSRSRGYGSSTSKICFTAPGRVAMTTMRSAR